MTAVHSNLLLLATFRAYAQTQPAAVLLWLLVNLISFGFEFNQWAVRREEAKKVDRGSLALLSTGTAAGIAVLVLAPIAFPAAAIRPAPVFFGIGMAVYLAGFAMRRWSEMTLGRYFTFAVMTSPDQPVVTNGPYRIVRHPGYTGVLLVVLGAGFVAGNWVGLAGWTILVMLPLLYRIRVEETALVAALGDCYRSYAAHHKRLVPLLW
ncbi:MAG TPA: isoprenylcysteine carboxylmethyltransferase family protein [Solirubrobacteraceae bacterium]|nr:isoprenylcysteine carboxylmethyltransferase family protein [Solirubrobacteraceae bacterium]